MHGNREARHEKGQRSEQRIIVDFAKEQRIDAELKKKCTAGIEAVTKRRHSEAGGIEKRSQKTPFLYQNQGRKTQTEKRNAEPRGFTRCPQRPMAHEFRNFHALSARF